MSVIQRSVALIALAAIVLAACGGAQTPPPATTNDTAPTTAPAAGESVTLNLWVFEGEEGFLDTLKEEFEKQNPNIVLEITEIPEDQYVTKIDTALAANDPPDIGFVYGGQQRWLKAGKFLPIDEMLAQNNIQPAEFNQNAMSLYCSYEGKYYCIGSYTGAVLLFYNKDLFDAAGIAYPSATEPMTFEEYADLARRLSNTSDNLEERIWGGSAGVTWWFADWATLYSADGRTAEGYVNDAATVRTYQLMADLVTEGAAPSDSDMQMLGDVDLLSQQKQAMAITDNFAIANMEAAGLRFGAAPPPVEERGDAPFIITWTDAFGVFSDSKDPQEAMKFLAFLATDGNRLRTEFDTMPLNMRLADELGWDAKNEGRAEAVQAISLARSVIFVPGFYEITGGPLGDAYNAIIEGMPAQEALDEAASLIQEDLDKAWVTWDQIR
ncbi:MAG TPA: sugar ABC transporter substrate-binding protein [Roseiflexaceae bacterium]|nr:sugar ABC transporter substrate-binding protein [Roseiflexaceae bacterium]